MANIKAKKLIAMVGHEYHVVVSGINGQSKNSLIANMHKKKKNI